MSRKKLEDMSPYERVEQRMKGLTNNEAEDVAVKILAQIVAKHVYSLKDGDEYFPKLMEKIMSAADEYAKKHSLELAVSSVFRRKQQMLKNS